MILIACQDETLSIEWKERLSDFDVGDKIAHDKRQLNIYLRNMEPEILIVHLSLLGKEGIDEIAGLHELRPQTKIIIMSADFKEREELFAVLFGARAYIHEDIDPILFLKVVKRVQEGEIWVDRQFVGRLMSEIEGMSKDHHEEVVEIEKSILAMTPRESEIAELIAVGASNRRIAEKLCISERTVKAHLGVIFKKVGINDRLQLALYMNKYHHLSSLWQSRRPTS